MRDSKPMNGTAVQPQDEDALHSSGTSPLQASAACTDAAAMSRRDFMLALAALTRTACGGNGGGAGSSGKAALPSGVWTQMQIAAL